MDIQVAILPRLPRHYRQVNSTPIDVLEIGEINGNNNMRSVKYDITFFFLSVSLTPWI